MGRFDWQTEEEGPITPASTAVSKGRRRKWLVPLIFASFVGLVVVAGWQLERQAESREEAVTADVLAAFNVWRQAVLRRDIDLLDTLLLDGGAKWTATQRRLMQSGRIIDRQDMGLALVAGGLEALDGQPMVDLADNWRSAEITFPLIYQMIGGEDETSDAKLDQTLFLRREGARWLLRQPEEAFWGIWRAKAGDIASVTFRARDEGLADRLLADLEHDLLQICATSASTHCQTETQVMVRLESDPAILFKPADRSRPAFLGRTFVLPSPTLVGNPVNENGYRAYYRAYSTPILQTFAASLDTPIHLPGQSVALLCFAQHDHVPRFYIYDPLADTWRLQLSDQAFRFLSADQSDSDVVLRQHMRGQPNRLRLLRWSPEGAILLHDKAYAAMTDHHVGWTGPEDQPVLLLSTFQGTTRIPSYRPIDAEPLQEVPCSAAGCTTLRPLDGFPIWSPDGHDSLVVLDGEIYRADEDGRAQVKLGEGHSPFWLDEERYGFARLLSNPERPIVEVVTGVVGEDLLERLWFTGQLDGTSFASSSEKPVFIQHIEAMRGEQSRLLMYGRQYAGADSQYAFLTLPLTWSLGQPVAGPAQLELAIDKPPARLPSANHPNGHVPFLLSPDGRWLTVAYLADKVSNEWHIQVVEIGGEAQAMYSTYYPGYSFSHPFFDWSSDGRWLLIVDEVFLRLAAPSTGFERVIAHDLRSCAYPAWINRSSAQCLASETIDTPLVTE